MKIRILIWNVWLDNQLQGKLNSNSLTSELDKLVEKYQPDIIGLNESLIYRDEKKPFVSQYLKKHGYKYDYYSENRPLNNEFAIGSSICSKIQLINTHEIFLGINYTGLKSGHEHSSVTAISAQVDESKQVFFILTHPINLKPGTFKSHSEQTKQLASIINTDYKNKNLIVAGDFNEPRFYPMSFFKKIKSSYCQATGTFINPTWRHNSWKYTLLRANLDRIFWTKNSSLVLEEFKIIESKVSDHRPLFATFSVK